MGMAFLTLVLFNVCAHAASPQILWTDVRSAPVGSHVVIAGLELDSSGEQRLITVEVPEGAGDSVWVRSGGVASNALPFSMHEGNLFYSTPRGSSTSDDCASPGHSCSLRRARLMMKPGDVLYLRGGTYTKPDAANAGNVKPIIWETEGGTAAKPKTFRNYPGEDVFLDGSKVAFMGAGAVQMDKGHTQIAGMRAYAGEFNVILGGGSHQRVANMEIFGCRKKFLNGEVPQCSPKTQHAQGIAFRQSNDGPYVMQTHCVVVGCDIHDHGSDRKDHAIYARGNYNVIAHNRLHHNPGYGVHGRGPYGDWYGMVVKGNLIYSNGETGSESGGGVMLAEGCHKAVVENNILWDNRACLQTAKDAGVKGSNTVRGNSCFRSRDGEAFFRSAGLVLFHNNLLYHKVTKATKEMILYQQGARVASNYNNIAVNWNGFPTSTNLFRWYEGATVQRETLEEFREGKATQDRNSLYTDPKVVNPWGNPPDARLQEGSALIGAGASNKCPPLDFALRPRTASCDIGALSFHQETSTTTTTTTAATTTTTTTSAASTTQPAASIPLLSDGVSVTDEWLPVSFTRPFDSTPIIVAGPLTSKDSDAAVVRIRSVNADSFEVRVQEFSNTVDPAHTAERLDYLAVPRGRHRIGSRQSATLYAGVAECSDAGTPVSFPDKTFSSSTPIVMATVVSNLDKGAPLLRVMKVTPSGFTCQVQGEEGARVVDGQEGRPRAHGNEKVHYIAVEPGVWHIGQDRVLEAAVSPTQVTHAEWTTVRYLVQDYTSRPHSVSLMQTRNGGDPAHLRATDKFQRRMSVRVEEDQTHDSEVGHIGETFGWLAVGLVDHSVHNLRSAALAPEAQPQNNVALSVAIGATVLAAGIAVVTVLLVKRSKSARMAELQKPLLSQ